MSISREEQRHVACGPFPVEKAPASGMCAFLQTLAQDTHSGLLFVFCLTKITADSVKS